jgi:hypothetical protein
MLGMKNYPREYIDGCRSRVASDVAAYRKLADEARKKGTSAKALDLLETTFFNNMVLLLDYLFVHRLRTVEGKDGNPLNQVRALCNSMLHNKNVLTYQRPPTEPGGPDTGIKLSPETSVLKYQVGDEIKVTEAEFALLSKAFFAEIESKYA